MARNLTSLQLIRYGVGYIFIASAIMKLFVGNFVSAFASFGIPNPATMVLVVAIVEFVCGILLILNYYVRNATIPLMVIIIAAILLTKIPLLHQGFFSFAFEARLDIITLILLWITWKNHK
ncbi:DoxX family protein [Aquibacillus kalidii]|uniref:DoxX family protein n=1 Tax=Aquibacillus kalidii TaxID=2762597 RepID=UPI0016490CDD|nr:DoxX family protein [Aquibacillus kalidii]